MNVTQATFRVLDKNNMPNKASDEIQVQDFWKLAEMEEMAALKAKGVIEEISDTEIPHNGNAVNTMWVYVLKSDFQGYVIRFKAGVVALGTTNDLTFAPVARMSSFRQLLALPAELSLQVYGADISTAYLNAGLGISQYLRSNDGYPCKVNGHMYVVLKALYGLRQSGREWNSELNKWLIAHGFQRSLTEPCLYYQIENDKTVYVLVYLFTELNKAYGIKDQGFSSQSLGVEVEQTESQIKIKQSKYAKEILTKFGYLNTHAVGNPMEVNAHLTPSDGENPENTEYPYREVVGMLLYLATTTRPDLAYVLGRKTNIQPRGNREKSVTLLSWYTRLWHYVHKKLAETSEVVLNGYCDSDWAMDLEARKSTTGFMFTLSNGAIAWMLHRQSIVALSTAEAEYGAACEATMEAIVVKNILQEIQPHHTIMLKLGIDSQKAYVMATNPTYSRRTRRNELPWHYVREQVERGAIKLHKAKGEDNPADALTKDLNKKRLERLLQLVGVDDND
ncbi:Integrase catalytic core protein [Phytophthora palmivora]|uniref:Integrase catalytic core protein n=1 Tax=Phytophthora palmivora TaxID=4796 RepID=A0A2P4Y2J5_9STRA|nr:Integrase catalytic core protein [Phytophthora palmivora]